MSYDDLERILEPPKHGDGHDRLRMEIGNRIARLEIAVRYHLQHHDAIAPVGGYASFYQRSDEHIAARRRGLEETLALHPSESLLILSQSDPWTLEANERIQTLRTQLVLMEASGQL